MLVGTLTGVNDSTRVEKGGATRDRQIRPAGGEAAGAAVRGESVEGGQRGGSLERRSGERQTPVRQLGGQRLRRCVRPRRSRVHGGGAARSRDERGRAGRTQDAVPLHLTLFGLEFSLRRCEDVTR